MQTSTHVPTTKVWVVSWMFNGKTYHAFYPSLIQAQLKYWQLEDKDCRSISAVKDE